VRGRPKEGEAVSCLRRVEIAAVAYGSFAMTERGRIAGMAKKQTKKKPEKDAYELAQESIEYLLDLHKLQGVVLVNLRNQIGAIKPDDLEGDLNYGGNGNKIQ